MSGATVGAQWRCDHCRDVMDVRFHRSHVVLCAVSRRLAEPVIERLIEASRGAAGA